LLVSLSVILYNANHSKLKLSEEGLAQAWEECNLPLNADFGDDDMPQKHLTMQELYGDEEGSEEGEGTVEFKCTNKDDTADVMARIYGFTMNYASAKFTDVFLQVLKASCWSCL